MRFIGAGVELTAPWGREAVAVGDESGLKLAFELGEGGMGGFALAAILLVHAQADGQGFQHLVRLDGEVGHIVDSVALRPLGGDIRLLESLGAHGGELARKLLAGLGVFVRAGDLREAGDANDRALQARHVKKNGVHDVAHFNARGLLGEANLGHGDKRVGICDVHAQKAGLEGGALLGQVAELGQGYGILAGASLGFLGLKLAAEALDDDISGGQVKLQVANVFQGGVDKFVHLGVVGGQLEALGLGAGLDFAHEVDNAVLGYLKMAQS